jgi:hypothetical protein
MPQCPSCRQFITYKLLENWFECPSCNRWLRMHKKKDGSHWLETGRLIDGQIQPVQLPKSGQSIYSLGNDLNIQRPTEPIKFQTLDIEKQKSRGQEPFQGKLEGRVIVRPFEETEKDATAKSSTPDGLVFGCGTFLVGLGIYVFSRLIGLQLLPSMYVSLMLVAVVSGLLIVAMARIVR